jgi:hypothetical protein
VPVVEKTDKDTFESEELAYLRWAEENQLADVYVPWTPVEHPDFANRLVEVGGIMPFAMKNPPYAMTDSLSQKHTDFIMGVAALRPRVDIINLETEKVGRNLFRVTADVINYGSFPTASQAGELVRWMQKTVLRLTPADRQKLISGKNIEVLGAIGEHTSVKRSWLIQGSGTVKLKAGAESTGFKEIEIKL